MAKRAWVLMLMVTSAGLALADVDQALIDSGWHELAFDNKKPNRYHVSDDGQIVVDGNGSVSVLWRPLQSPASDDLRLAWQWQVEAAPPPTDLSMKGGDDRPLSLYVSFKFDPDRSSFWERSKRALVQPFVEDELPGRVLLYIWGGAEASNLWEDSPYFSGIGKMKRLRGSDSPLGIWFEESIDLVADHLAAFGEEPTQPYQLAISSDGDDTASVVRARIANIGFGGEPIR